MIQDIAPHKLHNPYLPNAVPVNNSFVMIFKNGEILTFNGKDGYTFPTAGELPDALLAELIYLFRVDEESYFLLPVGDEEPDLSMLTDRYSFLNVRALNDDGAGRYRAFAAHTAKHLMDWYRDTRFCGRCGTKTVHSEKERAKVCPNCGYTMYPRIMPAVIVGVRNGDRLLITKYNRGFAHNALIAGFTEIGETLEETVAREVMEEAGIKVKNITYYKSQPWGTANDLLAGFYCDVDGDDTVHLDDQELKYAEWLKAEDIVFQPGNISLTNEMMKKFAIDHGVDTSY